MAITDQIHRRGSNGKRVLLPASQIPKYLWGPTSDRRHKVGRDVDRLTGDVDLYEVATSICTPGTPEVPPPVGDYTFTIDSWLEKGQKQYVKAIRWVAVIKMDSAGVPQLLYRQQVKGSDRKTVAGPFAVEANQRLFLSIQREGGVSAIQYRLTLDTTAGAPTPGPTPSPGPSPSPTPGPTPSPAPSGRSAARSKPAAKPRVVRTEKSRTKSIADKAWEMVGGKSSR